VSTAAGAQRHSRRRPAAGSVRALDPTGMLVAGCHGEPVIIPTVGHYLSETWLTTTRSEPTRKRTLLSETWLTRETTSCILCEVRLRRREGVTSDQKVVAVAGGMQICDRCDVMPVALSETEFRGTCP